MTDGQRETLVREVFRRITIDGKDFVSIEPKTERDILERELQEAKTQAAKARGPDRAQRSVEAESLARSLATFEVPTTPRLLADDVTPEAVSGLLAEQGGRLAIASAEGGLFEMIAGRYSDGVPNLDVFLKGYTGDTLRVDRRGRPPEFVPNPALTILLTCQPEVITDLATKKGFRGRGLLARFAYSIPQSWVGYRSNDAPPVPEAVRQEWSATVKAILRIPYPPENGDSVHLVRNVQGVDGRYLQLSQGARDLFQEFRDRVEVSLRPGGDMKDIADWGNKLPGLVARVAGVLLLLHWAASIVQEYSPKPTYPWDDSITEGTMEASIRIGKYFQAHANIAFGMMGADGTAAVAKRVWSVICKYALKEFTQRDL